MKQEKLLWRLQELKQEEAALLKKEELKPLVGSLKEIQEKLKEGEADCNSLMDKIEEGKKKALELEKNINNLEEQTHGGKDKLYGAKGSSMKELLSLQQSVLKLEDQGKEMENMYWEILSKIEEYKEMKGKLKITIKAWKKEYNEGVKKYKKIKAQLDLKQAEIKSKQEEVWDQLTPEVKKVYEEAVRRFSLRFIAMLQKGSCSACRISLPSSLVKEVKAGNSVCHCDSCGRILIKSF